MNEVYQHLAAGENEVGRAGLPRDPSRLQVAMYFDNAANDALDELEPWAKYWGQYYDPAVLKAAITALKAVKELVNK